MALYQDSRQPKHSTSYLTKMQHTTPTPLIPHYSKNLIIIIGGVRSGTTVFRHMLSTHPDVVDHGEIFLSSNKNGYFRILERIIKKNPNLIFPENNEIVFRHYLKILTPEAGRAVIDIKYEHLCQLPTAWQLPHKTPAILTYLNNLDAKIIHLKRNPFNAVISNLVAQKTKRYHVSAKTNQPNNAPIKISISRDLVIQEIKDRIQASDLVENTLNNQGIITIEYEELFDINNYFKDEICSKTATFIGIEDSFERAPLLQKVINQSLENTILNWHEICDLAPENIRS